MTLQEKIKDYYNQLFKNREVEKRNKCSIILAELQREPTKEISDDRVVNILKKLKKMELERISSSNNCGIDKDYMGMIDMFLPKEVTDEEIINWIKSNIDFNQFKNKMQAMKPIIVNFGTSVDGNKVKNILDNEF